MVSKNQLYCPKDAAFGIVYAFFNRDDSSPNKASQFLENQKRTIPALSLSQIAMRHTRGIICPFF